MGVFVHFKSLKVVHKELGLSVWYKALAINNERLPNVLYSIGFRLLKNLDSNMCIINPFCTHDAILFLGNSVGSTGVLKFLAGIASADITIFNGASIGGA